MSSFTIDAILGKQQECETDRRVESNSNTLDEETRNSSIGEFFVVDNNKLFNKVG